MHKSVIPVTSPVKMQRGSVGPVESPVKRSPMKRGIEMGASLDVDEKRAEVVDGLVQKLENDLKIKERELADAKFVFGLLEAGSEAQFKQNLAALQTKMQEVEAQGGIYEKENKFLREKVEEEEARFNLLRDFYDKLKLQKAELELGNNTLKEAIDKLVEEANAALKAEDEEWCEKYNELAAEFDEYESKVVEEYEKLAADSDKDYNDLVDLFDDLKVKNDALEDNTKKLSDEAGVRNRMILELKRLVKAKEEEVEAKEAEIAAMKARNLDYVRVLGPVAIAYLCYNHSEMAVEGVKLCVRSLSAFGIGSVVVISLVAYAFLPKMISIVMKLLDTMIILLARAQDKVWQYQDAGMALVIVALLAYYNSTVNGVISSGYNWLFADRITQLIVDLPLYRDDVVDAIRDQLSNFWSQKN